MTSPSKAATIDQILIDRGAKTTDDVILELKGSRYWDGICRHIICEAVNAEEKRFTTFAADIDCLHEMICERRTDEACALLRAMAPDHAFLSDAAQIMLAKLRKQK